MHAAASASRRKRVTTSGLRVNSGRSTLIANCLLGMRVWRARYTRPIPPSPSTDSITYVPFRFLPTRSSSSPASAAADDSGAREMVGSLATAVALPRLNDGNHFGITDTAIGLAVYRGYRTSAIPQDFTPRARNPAVRSGEQTGIRRARSTPLPRAAAWGTARGPH